MMMIRRLLTNKLFPLQQFKISHYAGEVVYDVTGFIDKNNDLLFRDLKKAMCSSKSVIISQLFHADELSNLRRPTTTATQFRHSLSNLMSLLKSKQPWYIRCIKPNEHQMAHSFDTRIVSHQVQYLGLMENLRVRRAGFAYRREYEQFLERYKCLSPETWPHYRGSAKRGVEELMRHFGFGEAEYKLGLTKIFIRFPKTLFTIEDAFQKQKHALATMIQALYRGHRQRQIYLQIRHSTILLQAQMRKVLAIRLLEKRKWAVQVVRNFVKGFMTRNDAPNKFNIWVIGNCLKVANVMITILFIPATVPPPSEGGVVEEALQEAAHLHSGQLLAACSEQLSGGVNAAAPAAQAVAGAQVHLLAQSAAERASGGEAARRGALQGKEGLLSEQHC